MKKLLLDTSIVIDFLRRKDKKETILYKIADEDLYASIITHTELYAGKSVWERNDAKNELEDVFSGITILLVDKDISQKAGHLKAFRPELSLLDCIIAATSIKHKLELATLNAKDFKKISEVKLFSK